MKKEYSQIQAIQSLLQESSDQNGWNFILTQNYMQTDTIPRPSPMSAQKRQHIQYKLPSLERKYSFNNTVRIKKEKMQPSDSSHFQIKFYDQKNQQKVRNQFEERKNIMQSPRTAKLFKKVSGFIQNAKSTKNEPILEVKESPNKIWSFKMRDLKKNAQRKQQEGWQDSGRVSGKKIFFKSKQFSPSK